MVLRVLAVLIGSGFLALPWAPGTSAMEWAAAILGVVLIAYGINGPPFLAKAGLAGRDPAPASADTSWFARFVANGRASLRSAPFMIFAVLAGVAFAWFWQLQFEVPRERQEALFPPIAMLTAAVLLLGRAAVLTLLQQKGRG